MNKIEQLIEELCPQGVEFKALGEVCDFKNGFAFKSSLFKESGLPIIRITNVDGKNVDLTDVKYFDPVDYSRGNPLNYPIVKGDVLIAMSGATTGKIGFFKSDETAYLNQRVGKFEPQIEILNNRYLYHFLLTKADFLYVLAGGGAQPNLSSNKLKEKLQIPIPPLAIQKEIVKILDNFTRLEAELEAELEARKKQYEHYREELLTFGDDVEWMSLGELFEFKNGINKGKEFFGSGNSIINYTDAYRGGKILEGAVNGKVRSSESDIERYNCKRGDMFFTRTSETREEIGYAAVLLSNIQKCVFSGFLLRARPKTSFLLPEYCAYCFSSNKIRKNIIRTSNYTTRVTTTGTILSKLQIPIPPLSKQKEIVAILDKFDALVNDISSGLPAEITARKKQYEYYRNQLLTFKPLELRDE